MTSTYIKSGLEKMETSRERPQILKVSIFGRPEFNSITPVKKIDDIHPFNSTVGGIKNGTS